MSLSVDRSDGLNEDLIKVNRTPQLHFTVGWLEEPGVPVSLYTPPPPLPLFIYTRVHLIPCFLIVHFTLFVSRASCVAWNRRHVALTLNPLITKGEKSDLVRMTMLFLLSITV